MNNASSQDVIIVSPSDVYVTVNFDELNSIVSDIKDDVASIVPTISKMSIVLMVVLVVSAITLMVRGVR